MQGQKQKGKLHKKRVTFTANGIPKHGCHKGSISPRIIAERTAPTRSNWNTFSSSKSLKIFIEQP
jgi:hypothetical protein